MIEPLMDGRPIAQVRVTAEELARLNINLKTVEDGEFDRKIRLAEFVYRDVRGLWQSLDEADTSTFTIFLDLAGCLAEGMLPSKLVDVYVRSTVGTPHFLWRNPNVDEEFERRALPEIKQNALKSTVDAVRWNSPLTDLAIHDAALYPHKVLLPHQLSSPSPLHVHGRLTSLLGSSLSKTVALNRFLVVFGADSSGMPGFGNRWSCMHESRNFNSYWGDGDAWRLLQQMVREVEDSRTDDQTKRENADR